MSDERIKKAAAELSAALTEEGGDFSVWANAIDVTTVGSSGPQYVWTIEVEERSIRRIAP